MSTLTMTPAQVPEGAICELCGSEADDLFVADHPDPETGYVVSLAICRACQTRREGGR